ncbi:MAG: outer membrane lipoprotein-sorting protein [Candidatus Tectomicrobia bacterium]|uniref:Outer membrane lipoprotein-sorting protein n=1 Tax=Tectimicrobiota bacterium TaxID=2528274 RepID=A0A932G179_UNCTE|nr:outer membrane lipoprotein-sorting protein [Candidatus Tectomicrobia bacterium]
MKIIVLAMIGMLCLTSSGLAIEGSDLLKAVDANLQPESFEAYRKLINIEPNGAKREFLFYLLKKGNEKVAILFLTPASEKGRATLRLGDNMWLYIPNVGKPIRITSLQSVVGGVFNNADILRLDYHVEYDVQQLEDKGEEYLLDLKAKSGAVAYDRLKMWVDKKTVVPAKIECYAATGLLIKTLYFKERKSFGDGVMIPAVVETDSPLYKGYRSIMVFARVKKRSIPDEVFTLDFLPKMETIR